MNANELRIGNFIKVNRFNIEIPARIENFDDLQQISTGHLKAEGEPLTEAWLLALLFEKTNENEYTLKKGGFKLVNHDCEFVLKIVNQIVCYNPIGTVHQLQNIYHSLTGIELCVTQP